MEAWATINIDLNKLIDTCSNSDKTKEEILEDFRIMNDENVHKVFRYRKFNDGFTDKLTCYNEGDKIIGVISPSYKEFLDKLFDTLNVNPNLRYLIGRDDQDLEDVLNARMEVLKTVSHEGDEPMLQDKFPLLYRTLQDSRKVINDIRKRRRELEKDVTKTPMEYTLEKEKLDNEETEYHKRALSPNFSSFLKLQIELYTRFIEGRKKYKELTKNTNYNEYIKANFDVNKVALYVVHGYLKAIEATDNREIALKYYNLVEMYINREGDKTEEITIDGTVINYDNIQQRFKKAQNKLNRVDIKLEWELLPAGSGYDSVTSGDTTKRRVPMSEEKIEELRAIGREQTKFYMNTNYSAKAIGLKKFAGYFAYIYPNGVVVLDKDFREKYPTTAEGAIYVMRARDFELLSGIGKTDLIKHPFLFGHRYHRGDWKTKINAYITPEGKPEEQEEAIQLIKKMQK